jgi:hypothetical protein
MAELTEPTTGSKRVALVPSVSSVVSVRHRASALGGVYLGRRDERAADDRSASARRTRARH